MEMVQVGFMVIGALFLWSSMSLTAPAPVTPNDVTGELNSLLEFIQKIRNKGTPLAQSDRRKQEALDKVFDEAEETIQDLLTSIEQKGEVIKHRTGTDDVEYKQGWDGLNESIIELKNAFSNNIALISQEFTGMQNVYKTLGMGQENTKAIIEASLDKSRDAQAKLEMIYEMYQ